MGQMSLCSFSTKKASKQTDFTVGGKFPGKSKKESFVNGFKEHIERPLLRIMESERVLLRI
jgi:hypothetical protein